MCTGAEFLLVSAAVSAGTAVYAGEQQKKAGAQQANAINAQAGQELDAARAQAERLRKATQFKRGTARAALAASGVDVDSGTSLLIDQTITETGMQDAYSTLLTGERRSDTLNTQAGLSLRSGRDAATAGYVQAGGSLLSSYGKYKQPGWGG